VFRFKGNNVKKIKESGKWTWIKYMQLCMFMKTCTYNVLNFSRVTRCILEFQRFSQLIIKRFYGNRIICTHCVRNVRRRVEKMAITEGHVAQWSSSRQIEQQAHNIKGIFMSHFNQTINACRKSMLRNTVIDYNAQFFGNNLFDKRPFSCQFISAK